METKDSLGCLGVEAAAEVKFSLPIYEKDDATLTTPPRPRRKSTNIQRKERCGRAFQKAENTANRAGCCINNQAVSSGKKEQSYSQVASLYECGIVLLHGNSFQRNLWSETLLFGLHITATAEKRADCRNTYCLVNHFKRQTFKRPLYFIF